MRLPSTCLLALSLLSTSLIACGGEDPPSPSEVRSALTNDLGHVLREGNASIAATDALPSGSAFGFATKGVDQSTYDVTVKSAPTTQSCEVTSGAGKIAGADVHRVKVTSVSCPPRIAPRSIVQSSNVTR